MSYHTSKTPVTAFLQLTSYCGQPELVNITAIGCVEESGSGAELVHRANTNLRLSVKEPRWQICQTLDQHAATNPPATPSPILTLIPNTATSADQTPPAQPYDLREIFAFVDYTQLSNQSSLSRLVRNDSPRTAELVSHPLDEITTRLEQTGVPVLRI